MHAFEDNDSIDNVSKHCDIEQLERFKSVSIELLNSPLVNEDTVDWWRKIGIGSFYS